jgi:hypothetical protein
MKNIAIVALAALGLGGCVAQNMNAGLNNLMGQNIHAAVDRIGYPNDQRQILGDTVYVWGTSQNTVIPMSTMNTTTGMVGGVPVYGTTTSTNFVPVNFNCTIQIATTPDGTIKNWRWSGNMGGCSSYANALKRR